MSRIKILITFIVTAITLLLIQGCATTGNQIDIDDKPYGITEIILDDTPILSDDMVEKEVIKNEMLSYDNAQDEYSQTTLSTPEPWPIVNYFQVDDSQIYLRVYHLGSAWEDYSEYVDVIYDCCSGAEVFVIRVNIPTRNFALIVVGIGQGDEDSIYLYAGRQVHLVDELPPEIPFVVRACIGGGIPSRAISFLDENDEHRNFLLSRCGIDGSIVLMPYPLDERLHF